MRAAIAETRATHDDRLRTWRTRSRDELLDACTQFEADFIAPQDPGPLPELRAEVDARYAALDIDGLARRVTEAEDQANVYCRPLASILVVQAFARARDADTGAPAFETLAELSLDVRRALVAAYCESKPGELVELVIEGLSLHSGQQNQESL